MSEPIVHLPAKFGMKDGADKFPLMVVLAVTYVCNARCPACPYTNSTIRRSYKDTPFMSESTFKLIANECGKYHSFIRLSGGGEPLLHPEMLKLIKYAKNCGAKIGLITNGSKLNGKTSEFLLNVGIDAIEISADAADVDSYSKVRPGLDFDNLVGDVRYLITKRNQLNSEAKVIVSIVNQKAIEDKLEYIVSFWSNIVDNVQVRKYLTWGIGNANESGNPTPYLEDRVPCPFPFERLNVDSRGKIEFCGFDIAGETDFGNVNDISIESVWQGEKFKSWRELLIEGKFEAIPICKKCPDWKYRSWNYNYWNVLKKAEDRRNNVNK